MDQRPTHVKDQERSKEARPYLTFVAQLESKTLMKIGDLVPPSLWIQAEEELEVQLIPGFALNEFKRQFWRAATLAWFGESGFRFKAVCKSTERSSEYWASYFKRTPRAFVWVLKPIEELLAYDPLIRAFKIRLHEIVTHPLRRRRGTLKYSDSHLMIRALEVLGKLR